MMKNTLLLFLLVFNYSVFGACDSPISRTNNAANSKLTSVKYNTDINTVYAAANTVDGSCIADSTVTSAKLDTGDLGPVVTAIKEGCKVTRSDAATLSVDKCRMSINGNMVTTTAANTQTWGCSGCSSESASQGFYLYAKADSTGTTLNLSILSSAPNADGYDSSNNRVLARFYNDNSSDIDQYSIDQWNNNEFIPQNTGWINSGAITITGITTDPTKGTNTTDRMMWRRVGTNMEARFEYIQTGAGGAGSGDYLFHLPTGLPMDPNFITYTNTASKLNGNWFAYGHIGTCSASAADVGINAHMSNAYPYDGTKIRCIGINIGGTAGTISSSVAPLSDADIVYSGKFSVPIINWAY